MGYRFLSLFFIRLRRNTLHLVAEMNGETNHGEAGQSEDGLAAPSFRLIPVACRNEVEIPLQRGFREVYCSFRESKTKEWNKICNFLKASSFERKYPINSNEALFLVTLGMRHIHFRCLPKRFITHTLR